MANPTTNYGFVMPTSTDLVTDLPADFDVFGQAVDNQMLTNANAAIAKTIVDAKGDIIAATAADTVSRLAVGANNTVLTADSTAATGLKWAASASGFTFVAGGSFSAQTAVSVNNCFSASYNNYVLILDITTTTTSNINFRLRASGTDSTASYNFNLQYFNPNSLSVNGFNINNGGEFGQLALSATTSAVNMYVTLRNPFLASPTYVSQQYSKNNPPSGDNGEGNGIHNVSTSYDGLTFFTTSGTISGNYKIYGMANS